MLDTGHDGAAVPHPVVTAAVRERQRYAERIVSTRSIFSVFSHPPPPKRARYRVEREVTGGVT